MMNEQGSAFASYMNRVQAYPRISREEELELFRRWRTGHDERAKDELVRSHLRYCVIIAQKYRSYGLPVSDLVAEGNFGLAYALTKFDCSRGTRFVTYAAYWIRAYVLSYVLDSWSSVGAGTGALRSRLFFKLRRERSRVMNLVSDAESAGALLAQRFGVSAAQIASMLQRIDTRDVSLDAKLHADGTATLRDALAAPGCDQEESIATTQIDRRVRHIVHQAIDTLDQREQYIVQHRLMQNPEDELSLAEIGRRLNVTRERARQLEQRAKKKLRQRILKLANPEELNEFTMISAA